MDSADLQRLLRAATAFPGVNVRIASIGTARRIVEEQLDLGRHIEISRLRAEHKTLGDHLHPDDRDSDLFELQQQVVHLLPKVFRGGYLVSLWSVLERCTHDIASIAGERIGKPISGRLFRRPFFESAQIAFRETVGLSAFPDNQTEIRLLQLQVVRNILAHHDGRVSELKPPLSGLTSEQLAAHELNVVDDDDFSYVVPTEEYLVRNTKLVSVYLHGLEERVFNVLEPE